MMLFYIYLFKIVYLIFFPSIVLAHQNSPTIKIQRYQQIFIIGTNTNNQIKGIWYDHKYGIYFTNESQINTNDTTLLPSSLIIDSIPKLNKKYQTFKKNSDYSSDKKNWQYNARQKVLEQESLIPTSKNKNKIIIHGLWYDHYSGLYTTNTNVQVDHFIPRAETYRSGGYAWDTAKKKAFVNCTNDPALLIVVSGHENRAKSDLPPSVYLPPNEKFQTLYKQMWIDTKNKWDLEIDIRELEPELSVSYDI